MTTGNPPGLNPLRRPCTHSINYSRPTLRPLSHHNCIKRGEQEFGSISISLKAGHQRSPPSCWSCLAAGLQKLCLITLKNSLKKSNAASNPSCQIMQRLLFRQPYASLFSLLSGGCLPEQWYSCTQNSVLSHISQFGGFWRAVLYKSSLNNSNTISTQTCCKAHRSRPVKSLYNSGLWLISDCASAVIDWALCG